MIRYSKDKEQLRAVISKFTADLKKIKKANMGKLAGVKNARIEYLSQKISDAKKLLLELEKYEKKTAKEASKKPKRKTLVLTARGMELNKAEYADSDLDNHSYCSSFVDKEGQSVYISFSAWHRPISGKKLRYDKKTTTHLGSQVDTPKGSYSWIALGEDYNIPYTKKGILDFINKRSRDNYTKIIIKK